MITISLSQCPSYQPVTNNFRIGNELPGPQANLAFSVQFCKDGKQITEADGLVRTLSSAWIGEAKCQLRPYAYDELDQRLDRLA